MLAPIITDGHLAEIEQYASLANDKMVRSLVSIAEMHAILVRLRQTEKDAGRYRWLRSSYFSVREFGQENIQTPSLMFVYDIFCKNQNTHNADGPDTAIDVDMLAHE